MGLTVLDAGVVIGLLDRRDAHHESATAAVHRLHDDDQQMCLPASALAEALVGPHRRGGDAAEQVHAFIERVPIDVVALDSTIADAAAEIRGRLPTIKLPDALVIATAVAIDAVELVTTDRGWPADVLGVSVTVL